MKRPIIIMISNQKGGVGKTTCTLELCTLFGKEAKVLGIDLDPQTNLSLYAGAEISEEKTIKEVLDGNMIVEDAVQHLPQFDILIGNKKLSNASKLYGDADDIFLLSDALENIDYDYIFIDSAPGRSPLLYMEYICSDYIIAPTECDDGAIQGLLEVGEDVKRFKKRNQSHAKIIGLLLNKVENTEMHRMSYETLQYIGQKIGCQPFKTIIRKSIVASEAKTAKKSIVEYKATNNIAKDYIQLKEEIKQRIAGDKESKNVE